MFKKLTLSLASVAVLSLLVACSNNQAQPQQSNSTPASQASSASSVTSTASSNSSEASVSQAATDANLDGTYKGKDEGNDITLTITGTSGTWTSVELDGEQESKPITVDVANKRLTVGDNFKFYTLNGNQLTLEDDDRDPTDTIILTK